MPEPDVSALLTVRQAIEVIDAEPVSPRAERRRLADAQGMRLAADLAADRDYPPFDKSVMDGYAVRSADVAAAPAVLRVVGEIPAGQWPRGPVGPWEAMAVMTGAPLPDGADGVVPVEDAEEMPAGVCVRRADRPERYIARRGSDVPAGQIVLPRGTLLEAAQLAVAASVGAAEVDVFARPRVAILGTGDELVPVEQTPGPAQIRNSNNPMLVALLRRLGCDVTDLGTAPDRPDAIRRSLEAGLAFDTLFVTGGMSMGDYDYVPRTLQDLGVELKIAKLRVKPGKPFVFGTRNRNEERNNSAEERVLSAESGGKNSSSLSTQHSFLSTSYVFGLPGNPVAGFVCTIRLASRLLARLAGGTVGERWLSGRLEAGLPANGPREFYQPAIREAPPGGKSAQNEIAAVRPLAWKGSADVFTLAAANALIVRAENEPPLAKGTLIRVLEI